MPFIMFSYLRPYLKRVSYYRVFFILNGGGEDRDEKISPGQEEGEHDWFSISVQSAKES